MEIPKLNIGVVTGPDDVVKFWTWLQDRPKGYVAIDTETGNTDPDKDARHWWLPGAHVRMVQFGDAQGGWAIPMQGWESLVRGAFDWLNKARIKQVWHNGFTFDATFLQYCHGIKLDPTLIQDTFVYAGLIGYAEDSRELKRIAESKFGAWASAGADQLHTGMRNAGWNWSSVPMTWMPYPVYGVMDTAITALVYESWEDDIARVAPFHALEIAAAWMTNQACMTGITVDGKYLERTYRQWRGEADRLKAECAANGWGEPTKTAQIRAILAEANVLDDKITTEGGLISVDKKQLTQAASKHPLAQLVLDHRYAERVAENYLRKLWGAIDYAAAPGIVHPSIWTMEAKTGRMSASNPPVQQFPASDPTVRNAVIADSRDHVLIAADYGQIETRGWAALFDDQPMKDMINETDRTGQDYFALLAQRMFHDPTITKASPIRKNTKNIGYAMQYGAQLKKLGEMTGLPEDEVRPVVEGYREMFPSYRTGGSHMVDDLGGGIARTVLPDGRSYQVRTWAEHRKLPNYRIQGWAATVLKKAMVATGAAGLGPAFRLPVHDELIFSVPKEDAKDAAMEIKECMDSIVPFAEYGVRVTTEPNIALRWGALKG